MRKGGQGALRQGAVHFSIEIKSSIGAGVLLPVERRIIFGGGDFPVRKFCEGLLRLTDEGVPPYMVRNGVVKPRTSGTLAPTWGMG